MNNNKRIILFNNQKRNYGKKFKNTIKMFAGTIRSTPENKKLLKNKHIIKGHPYIAFKDVDVTNSKNIVKKRVIIINGTSKKDISYKNSKNAFKGKQSSYLSSKTTSINNESFNKLDKNEI